jgi:membrane fusion protein
VSSLFRPEAVAAQQQARLGTVQLVRPLALAWLTAAAALLALALATFGTLAEYTRKAQVAGVLAPDLGLIRIVPAAAGTVLERHVGEGQTVRAGDTLFVLAQDRLTRDDAVQEALDRSVAQQSGSLEASASQQRAQSQSRAAALTRRLQALDRELVQFDAEAALQTRRLELAQRSLARLQSLLAQSFVSDAQVQTRTEEVLALQAQLQALARQRAALQRDRAEIEGERDLLPLQLKSTLAEIDRAQSELARVGAEQSAVRRVVVRAPQDGTVNAVLADLGQAVTPASALASLVPAGATLQAQLYAPSRAIGFVRPGQTVRLRFEAFPYAKYGHRDGTVLLVSRVPLAAADLAGLALPAQATDGEPRFRITVALAPAAPGQAELPLGPGLRLQADVLLERRRLVEWLFEPLLGLKERL